MELSILAGAPCSEILKHDLNFHRCIAESSKNDDFIRLYEAHNHQLFDISRKHLNRKDVRLMLLTNIEKYSNRLFRMIMDV